jgi:TonB family protein
MVRLSGGFIFLLAFAAALAALNCASTQKKAEGGSSALIDGGGPDVNQFEEAPRLIRNVRPEYPPNALEAGITGTVWVKVLVDTLGNVNDPTILNGDDENVAVFEQSACDAAVRTKWKPAISKGKPINVWVTFKVEYNFK